MNETYEWLYDHYALPLMQVRDGADQIKQAILSHSDSGDRVFLGGAFCIADYWYCSA